jgi:hypothetical protein
MYMHGAGVQEALLKLPRILSNHVWRSRGQRTNGVVLRLRWLQQFTE